MANPHYNFRPNNLQRQCSIKSFYLSIVSCPLKKAAFCDPMHVSAKSFISKDSEVGHLADILPWSDWCLLKEKDLYASVSKGITFHVLSISTKKPFRLIMQLYVRWLCVGTVLLTQLMNKSTWKESSNLKLLCQLVIFAFSKSHSACQ